VNLEVARTVREVRERLAQVRHQGQTIGLVPTMGALHAGHASLIEKARSDCYFVVVSIFVNPLQFGPNEDYLRYPRPLAKDLDVCREKGVDFVFTPEAAEIYPSEQRTFIEVTRLGDHLCGAFRPGHFRGVATVVAKLFNIIQPDRAYFGEKDYQQFCIIRRMARDLNLATEIVPVPIYRGADGLALSSRNAYLNTEERAVAPVLFRALQASRKMIEDGERDPEVVKKAAARILAIERVRSEYFEIVDPVEVQPVNEIDGEARIAGAIWVGKTRLIDNVAAVPRRSRN
jgi:pantoate--beta-alanine ligase